MDILKEIQKAVATFDSELFENEEFKSLPNEKTQSKNEDEYSDDKIVTVDDYQNAVDSSVDPEDLNFSMDSFDDDDDEEDVEQLPIPPQSDADEKPIKVGDTVQKLTRNGLTGKVLAVGELVEVEWNSELVTLEYPEELVHAEDEKELEKLHSIDTNPPIPIETDN